MSDQHNPFTTRYVCSPRLSYRMHALLILVSDHIGDKSYLTPTLSRLTGDPTDFSHNPLRQPSYQHQCHSLKWTYEHRACTVPMTLIAINESKRVYHIISGWRRWRGQQLSKLKLSTWLPSEYDTSWVNLDCFCKHFLFFQVPTSALTEIFWQLDCSNDLCP